MKTILQSFLSSLFSMAFLLLFGQHVFVAAHPTPIKSHDGFVVLNNSDSLYGLIELNQYQKKAFGLMISINNEKRFLSYQDIHNVRLFDYDSSIVTTQYTDYRKLTNKPVLCRHIASGAIDIYDNSPFANEKKGDIGEGLYVISNNEITKISRTFSLFVSDDLLKYTNKKYDTHYKTKDFASLKSLLKFIADKG